MTSLIGVRNVTVRVGAQHLLEGVSLELNTGELTALLGPNGAGKSTLLRGLIGEQAVGSGQIYLLGRELSSYPSLDRARLITLVPQEQPADFPLRVRELVALGRHPHRGHKSSLEDRDAVRSALERTDLTALEDRDVATLSGGERQRASLARALAQRTQVLLLDEPTAHLDIAHQMAILELARELARAGSGVMIALHDLGLAVRFADRLIVLDQGRVVACGPPEEVLTSERLERTFGVDAEIERDDLGRIRHLTLLRRAAGLGARSC